MSPRRPVNARPARPGPYCEECGGDVWWAWGVHGKVWTPLVPERHALEGGPGTYQVWADAHGGLLCKYWPPGQRGDMEKSWRGNHHNAKCGRWRYEVTAGLIGEATAAVAVLADSELLAISQRLRGLQDEISGQIRRRALEAGAEERGVDG